MTDVQESNQASNQPSKKKKWVIIGTVVIGIFLLIAIIGAMSGDDYDYLTNDDYLKMRENPSEYTDRIARFTGVIADEPVMEGDVPMFRLTFGDPERNAVYVQFLGSETSLLKKEALIELECTIDGTQVLTNAYGEEYEFFMVSGLSAKEGNPDDLYLDPGDLLEE